MTKYDLTNNERDALNSFIKGLFISAGIILLSVLMVCISNDKHTILLAIGGAIIGFIIMLDTFKRDEKAHKELYPSRE